MVIIKASYVAAILSCFLFLQADCGDYLVNISRPWADLDQNSWKYAGTFSAGLQEIGPPALPRNQRFSVWYDYGHAHVTNVGMVAATCLLHDSPAGGTTEEINIEPGDTYILQAENVSLFIKTES